MVYGPVDSALCTQSTIATPSYQDDIVHNLVNTSASMQCAISDLREQVYNLKLDNLELRAMIDALKTENAALLLRIRMLEEKSGKKNIKTKI